MRGIYHPSVGHGGDQVMAEHHLKMEWRDSGLDEPVAWLEDDSSLTPIQAFSLVADAFKAREATIAARAKRRRFGGK